MEGFNSKNGFIGIEIKGNKVTTDTLEVYFNPDSDWCVIDSMIEDYVIDSGIAKQYKFRICGTAYNKSTKMWESNIRFL